MMRRHAPRAMPSPMPTAQTLDRFIALVEAGEFLQAIEDFYAPEATMQENFHPPRAGKPALLAQERQTLARTRRVTARRLGPVFVQDDRVVIRWRFEFENLEGRVSVLEELAYQHWQGEQIVQEQFFYDPAQLKVAA
jgi:hypothetical protein